MGNSMELVFILLVQGLKKKENGKTEKELNG
jgi:hypothetical protein